MKKAIYFILSVVMFICLCIAPVKVSAADYNSLLGIVNIKSGSLNVRSAASTNGAVIASLKKDNYVTLISKSGEWWKVEYQQGKYGYCHSDYIKTLSSTAMKVKITSGTLNVRSGPSTKSERIAGLSKGQTVLRINTNGDWSRIVFSGTKTGYVSSKYLAAADGNTVTYSAVGLKVPLYKQSDSRWANVKLGSSGKTMAKIGCATTSIAMIESFKSGKTIYPDAMAKKLSYTSSGSVYWPKDYKAVTSSSAYLEKIYGELKKGKAVLFGAKNSYGSRHWVVITGFKGGNNLSTEGFTINDPATKNRTTLKQFLSAYPVFYKYFTY